MSTKPKPAQKTIGVGPPPMIATSRRMSSLEFNTSSNNLIEKLADKLVEFDEDNRRTAYQWVKLRTKHFLDQTWMGTLYQQMMLAISVLSCFEFIYQTYLDPYSKKDEYMMNVCSVLELVLSGLFAFDWFLMMFTSDRFWPQLFSFYSAIDMMTVIGICSTYKKEPPPIEKGMGSLPVLYVVLCGLGTVRILRALRFKKYFQQMEDEVQRFLATMCLDIVVMILFNSAVMQYLEIQQGYPYHTWTYYMLVTIATVGYGDIVPQTDLGRFVAMCMICFAIITVPNMTNKLIEKMSLKSVYARASYHNQTNSDKHVLICGDTKSSSLEEFFEELFHADHHMDGLHAVILQPEAPSYEMLTILKDPRYSLSVTYLEGSALNEKDLDRALAGSAKAVFIMTNKFSADPDEEDAKTILQQFSIQRYLRANSTTVKGALFCMQLIRPENKRHLVSGSLSFSERDESSDLIACLNEIKMGVIAKAVMFPGASTLIMNLLTSFTDEESNEFEKKTNVPGIETLDDDFGGGSDWIGEYQRGCDWEIYTTELSEDFEGDVFWHLSNSLYQATGVVLFALEVEDIRKDKVTPKMYLNPAQFVIPSQKDFKLVALVLARNKKTSDLSCSKAEVSNFTDQIADHFGFPHMIGIAARVSRVAPSGALPPDSPQAQSERHQQKWQQLLRSREVVRTAESIQEENHKQEDKYLRVNHYLRQSVFDLQEALIRTSLMEEMPHIDNHIIIIGKALSNIYDLIRPLRARQLGVLKPIVIVYPHEFPVTVWQRISIFESIYIVRGSALDEADIRRAGIFKAKQIVVLADASAQKAGSSANSHGLDALVDADAIFCYQCVRRMNESAQVVVEIVRHTNVGYLDPESGLNSGQLDYKFTPQYASGALFVSSFLDTLVCQAFFNTKIIDMVSKLIGSTDTKDNSIRETEHSSNSKRANQHSLLSSSLYQISLPEGLESRTYGALYTLLAKRHQIPLGILRGVFPHTKCGPLSNKAPYVFTNPPKDTELFSCDKVFVLSQTPIKIGKSMRNDSQSAPQNAPHNRRKSSEDVLCSVDTMREEMKSYIDIKFSAFTEENNRKYDTLLGAISKISNNTTTSSVTDTSINRNTNNSVRQANK